MPEVHEIFKTLEESETKDFKSAVKALTEYFEPEKNVIYRTYVFRQATQGKEESIDEFHTRLRGLAKYCEFTNIDFEIKMQIVTNGISSRLRKKALGTQNIVWQTCQSMDENTKLFQLKPLELKNNPKQGKI